MHIPCMLGLLQFQVSSFKASTASVLVEECVNSYLGSAGFV